LNMIMSLVVHKKRRGLDRPTYRYSRPIVQYFN
jgi:hypothetical protein